MTTTNSAQILDGKALLSELKEDLKKRVDILKAEGITPGLGTLLVGNDIASQKYVTSKHRDCADIGINSIRVDLPSDADEARILAEVEKLNQSLDCTAYIVQLPLPKGVETNKVLERIDPRKDADGLHPYNLGALVLNVNQEIATSLPCTPLGIIKLVNHYLGEKAFEGKHVAVLGRGITVGRSIGLLLSRRDINATVTLCHTGTKNLEAIIQGSDIIIAAVGQAHFVRPEWVKDQAILIDVGVSRGADGKIQGDIHPDAYAKASWYSPNPGGVGPMTRCMLLENVVRTCERGLAKTQL